MAKRGAGHTVGNMVNTRFDRRIDGIGRIAQTLGTNKADDVKLRVAFLLNLMHRAKNHDTQARATLASMCIPSSRVPPAPVGTKVRSIEEVYTAGDAGLLFAGGLLSAPLFPTARRVLGAARTPKKKPCSPLTIERYLVSVLMLERHIQTYLGLDPASLTVADLNGLDWLTLQDKWPTSGADFNRMRQAVLRFLSLHLAEEGGVTHPFRAKVRERIGLEEEVRQRRHILTPASFEQLLEVIDEKAKPGLVVMTLLGLRMKQYEHLTPASYEPTTRVLQVIPMKGHTRTEENQLVVPEPLVPWVLQCLPPRVKRKRFGEHLERACAKLKLPLVTAHALRHACAIWTLENGGNLQDAANALGHRDLRMVQEYLRWLEKTRAQQHAVGYALKGMSKGALGLHLAQPAKRPAKASAA